MVTNVPDAEEMKQAALWLFFNAWEQVLRIVELSLTEEFGSTIVKGHIQPSTEFKDEIDEFIDKAQLSCALLMFYSNKATSSD